MIRRHHILLPSLIAAGLAVPAAASATTYCAHASALSCRAGQVDVGTNLSTAFAAAGDGVADRLEIHPGSYTVATGLIKNSADPLAVVGDSRATTILNAGSGVGSVMIGSRLDVSDLTIHLPTTGAQSNGVHTTGPAAVHDVAVDGGTDFSTAVIAAGDVAVDHVVATFTAASTTGVSALVQAGATPTVTDSTFTVGTGWGISLIDPSAALTVRRVSGSGRSLLQIIAGSATVTDSAWETYAGAAGDLDARCSVGNVDVSLDHVTFTASSGGTTKGIYAECMTAGRHTTVTATNSIFNVLARSFVRAGAAGATTTIGVGSSLFLSGGATDLTGLGGGEFTFLPGNVDDFAGFVNWPTDLRLADNSPAIDAGSLAFASQVTDLDGNARPLDGNNDGSVRQDMGAYEHAGAGLPAPPVIAPAAAATPSTWTGDPVAPEATVPEPPRESPPVTPVVPSRGLSVADIRAALRAGIRTGHLRSTGAVQRFAWPTGGRITVTWNARGVLAKGTRVRGVPGRTALAVRRTKAGRAALAPGRLVVLRATWRGAGLKTSVTMRRRIAR